MRRYRAGSKGSPSYLRMMVVDRVAGFRAQKARELAGGVASTQMVRLQLFRISVASLLWNGRMYLNWMLVGRSRRRR